MKTNKLGNNIMLLVGLLVIFFGWFNYSIYTPVSNTDSSRLKDLNWLHENLGKTPTALLLVAIGIFICVFAIKKLKKRG